MAGLVPMAELTPYDSEVRPWKIRHLLSVSLCTLVLGTQPPWCEEAQGEHGEGVCCVQDSSLNCQPCGWVSELSGNSIHSYQVIQSFSFIQLRSQASLSRDKPSYCAPFQIFLTHGILKHNKMAVVLYHMFGVACYAVIVTEALSCKASCPGSHSKLV